MKRIASFIVMAAALIMFGSGTADARLSNDRDSVKKAAAGDIMEISLGKMAERQASSEEVKKFGRTMVRDHTKASEKLQEIASKNNIQLPKDMDKKEHSMVQHLSTKKGKDFDRAYMEHMVKDHKKDVKMFEQMAKSSNPDLRNYAKETLPTLKKHLRMAEDVYSKVKRG